VIETGSVVVPPLEVKTWLTIGDEAMVTASVAPLGVTAETYCGVEAGA
jgi:hypothetical protein